jgi:hypothetical protein
MTSTQQFIDQTRTNVATATCDQYLHRTSSWGLFWKGTMLWRKEEL